ncbi:MAG: hypothetical protein O3A46_03535, partial [Candidatus Poribacteria bacterium]|nr:hypothetical protein [Candidatus Poribacteria bacterium]
GMGKIRVKIGQSVAERYALAAEPGDAFRTDDTVEIVRVTPDCVYVRRPYSLTASDSESPIERG